MLIVYNTECIRSDAVEVVQRKGKGHVDFVLGLAKAVEVSCL